MLFVSHLKATPTTTLAWGCVQGSVCVDETGISKGKMVKENKGMRLITYNKHLEETEALTYKV